MHAGFTGAAAMVAKLGGVRPSCDHRRWQVFEMRFWPIDGLGVALKGVDTSLVTLQLVEEVFRAGVAVRQPKMSRKAGAQARRM